MIKRRRSSKADDCPGLTDRVSKATDPRAKQPDSPGTEVGDVREPEAIRRGGSAEENYEQRVLAVFVVDVSGSLAAHAQECQAGIDALFEVLTGELLAAVSVEACFVTVATEAIGGQFQVVAVLQRPQLRFGGSTALGAGIMLGLDRLEQRWGELTVAGIPVSKALFALITDGQPTDAYETAVKRLRSVESKLRLNVFPVAAGTAADLVFLSSLSGKRKVAHLKDFDFKGLFSWFSEVLVRYSRSRPGEAIEHPPIDGWSRST